MTPATRVLDRADVAYRLLPYDHDPAASSFGMEAAEVLGLDPDAVFKTLMASLGDAGESANLVVAIVPVSQMLNLKLLADAAGTKRARMAEVAAAERSSGYVAGGISPFGQRIVRPTFVDETIEVFDEVYVSGGRRGLDLAIAPADLIAVLGAVVADLTG